MDNSYVFQMQECNGTRTVYGLWPRWGQWCSGTPYDPKAIEPLRLELARYWPLCGRTGNGTTFYEHVWAKHGTCSGMSEFNYFSTAIALRNVYANSTSLHVCMDTHFNQIECPTDIAERRGATSCAGTVL